MASKNRKGKCIAVFGTGSDVGKSIVTTALCRYFRDMGIKTAPYKAQNMSNNSGVTPDGLEMGRAQIVQAEAAGVVPHVDMNPVLLKPCSDTGSQVVLMGKVDGSASASDYHSRKERLFKTACDALDRLRRQYDLVVIEGAGSCAEVNLMKNDVVNFRVAEYADAPVILTADIHRGGVFGQIVGTLACLPETYREMIRGFVINRFRGDISLFEDGVRWIENRTGKPVFGVLPWFSHFKIEDEDSVVIEKPETEKNRTRRNPDIAIIRLPHISNFTDFDPFLRVKGIRTAFFETPFDLSSCRAVILPGSKSSRHDLCWLKETGWEKRLKAYAENSGRILGICGGYQMLGDSIADPEGVEGMPGETPGLGLLPVKTTLEGIKTTTRTDFTWNGAAGSGYEIHMGRTVVSGSSLLEITGRNGMPCRDSDGCISGDGRIVGTYMHGFLDNAVILRKWLRHIGFENIDIEESGIKVRDISYGLLSDHFEKHIDVGRIAALVSLE